MIAASGLVRCVPALHPQRLSDLVQIMKEDDGNWPPPDRVGRQELEVILGDQHISFTTTKLGSLMQARVQGLGFWPSQVPCARLPSTMPYHGARSGDIAKQGQPVEWLLACRHMCTCHRLGCPAAPARSGSAAEQGPPVEALLCCGHRSPENQHPS